MQLGIAEETVATRPDPMKAGEGSGGQPDWNDADVLRVDSK